MKLQISGGNLRFRIDEAELDRLLAGETVSDETELGHGELFRRSVRLDDIEQPSFWVAGTHWQITLPRQIALDYAQRLPCREGLEFVLSSPSHLTLDFEVDVRDSMRVRGARRKSNRTRIS